MEDSLYLNPLRPQPFDGGDGTKYVGMHELVDFLPGTSMRFWYTSKPDSYGKHWHDAMEIISCNQGYYLSEIEGVCYRIEPCDVLLIPAGTIHTLAPKDDCRGYVQIISLRLLDVLKSSNNVMPLLSKPRFISHAKHPGLSSSTNTILQQMQDEYFSDNDLRELSVYSYLLQLFTIIGRDYFDNAQTTMHLKEHRRKEYADKFNDILAYLGEHYAEEITLEQVAQKYGFSKYYFSRIFGQYTSYSFTEYITEQRLRAAKSMLMKKDYSICEISERAGFNSLSTFNRVFKDKIGCSPSHYQSICTNPTSY